MGYLVSITLIEQLGQVADLERLPRSVPWRAFALPNSDLTLIEWAQRPNPNNPPPHEVKFPKDAEFARRPSGVSFPDKFGDDIPGLDDLYQSLQAKRRASSLPKVAIHLSKAISEFAGRTTTIMSDDDGWDFYCQAHLGRLTALEFNAGEIADGEFEVISMNGPGVFHHTTYVTEQTILHRIAESAATALDERLSALFGFEGDPSLLQLVEKGRATQADLATPPPPTSPAASKRPFWKLW